MPRDPFVIAQLSDIHCGSVYFDATLLETAVKETIGIRPDLVVIGGDLTAEGYAHEFREAQQYLEPLFEAGLNTLVIPGNHDAKNVGYLHFRDAFGAGDVPEKGDRALRLFGGGGDHDPAGMSVQVVAIDSTKPDLAEGEVGRERYDWIRDRFSGHADLRLFVLHHHLVPVPGTGRERNTVWDSGDVLALLHELDVHLVLSGHKHVPHVWLLNGMFVVNSGTVSTYRLRGYTRPSYNVLEVTPDHIRVTLKYPGTGERLAGELDRRTGRLESNGQLNAMFDKAALDGVMAYIRMFQTAIDPSEVTVVRELFNDDVRPALDNAPGCVWVELVVSTEGNAGGLVEGCVISKWDSMTNLETGLESRGVQEALVRVRGLFRQEPVIKVYEVLE